MKNFYQKEEYRVDNLVGVIREIGEKYIIEAFRLLSCKCSEIIVFYEKYPEFVSKDRQEKHFEYGKDFSYNTGDFDSNFNLLMHRILTLVPNEALPMLADEINAFIIGWYEKRA